MARPPRFKRAVKRVRAEDLRLETWMLENFSDLNEAYPTGRLNLRELSQVIQTAGLTNTHGGRLSDTTISKTWARVRKRMLTARPLHLPKSDEIAPGVIVLPEQDARPQPAPSAAVAYAGPSAPISAGRPIRADLNGGEPGVRRLTAEEKLARIIERTYASHPQMPKPIK